MQCMQGRTRSLALHAHHIWNPHTVVASRIIENIYEPDMYCFLTCSIECQGFEYVPISACFAVSMNSFAVELIGTWIGGYGMLTWMQCAQLNYYLDVPFIFLRMQCSLTCHSVNGLPNWLRSCPWMPMQMANKTVVLQVYDNTEYCSIVVQNSSILNQ